MLNRLTNKTNQVKAVAQEGVVANLNDLSQLRYQAANLLLSNMSRVKSAQSGDFESALKGRGIEFDQVRQYQPGDDIRHMDWRVTARTGRPHIKEYREEKERPVFICVDMSSSMFFGSKVRFKSVLAAHIASLLGWSAILNGDKLGGIIFNEKIHSELRPLSREKAISRFNQHLAKYSKMPIQQSSTDVLSMALMRLQAVTKPGCLIVIISDFLTTGPAFQKYIARLKRHNEILMCHVSDGLEKEPPPYGYYSISDGEREIVLDTSDFNVREQYRTQYLERIDNLSSILRSNHIPLLLFDTKDDPYDILRLSFARRAR